ncbi:hypothetical protein BJY01DRAFT_260427 [Aspergillus pseudoustus]|uniref:Glucose-methanol-choline oxidoreductase N-terminal domain-containing protein n=1 Tax=Aspergillus pseudoustus TaxID=1810923 RepID=A0ABR4IV34_9EURO
MVQKTCDRPDNYPTLSRPFSSMKSEYDVIVIGSGYGAGVAASRMARAGKSVAVLELGCERRPGSFPLTLRQCLRELAISGARTTQGVVSKLPLSGKTKLFQLKLGEGQHAFCAHGLGGGSLINAGVFLEATESTFGRSAWPTEMRENPRRMEEYYERAAHMLQPSPYPDSRPNPKKLDHLNEQATLLGREATISRVPLTTFFESGRNSAGVPMRSNAGLGHESTGLNDGSKNSVAVTYLADAWNWGAEMFCGCEVRYVEEAQDGRGYTVYFTWHDTGRVVFAEAEIQLFWVKAKEFCFLGAGAIGTTEILLRSRKHGLPLSPLVGRNMSGNGDILLFGYNGAKDVNGVSGASSTPGPTITGMIDNRRCDSSDPLSGYIIEDGCIPQALAPVLQIMFGAQTLKKDIGSFLWHPYRQTCRTLAALKSAFGGPYTRGGAMQRTATYLVMSHDSNEISLTLKGDDPHLEAGAEGRSQNVSRILRIINTAVELAGGKLGFSYFGNTSSPSLLTYGSLIPGRNREEVSVHMLGGANMSRNGIGRDGVTNHRGQVFTGHGSDVHSGLICCDASVIPTSIGEKADEQLSKPRLTWSAGVNPLATITALAERSVALIAEESGCTVYLGTGNGTLDCTSKPKISHGQNHSGISNEEEEAYESTGWQFTEALVGHISVPSRAGFQESEAEGKGSMSGIRMLLTVDLGKKARGSGPEYKGAITGTVSCRALSQRTLRVISGQLEFFVPAEEDTDATGLVYRLRILSVEGREYDITGYKTLDRSAAWSVSRMWRATTAVNLRIATDQEGAIGAGVVRVAPSSFARQMRSFRPTGDLSFVAVWSLLVFLLFFALQIIVLFFHPLIPRRRPFMTTPSYPPKRPATSTRKLLSSDGVECSIQVYDPVSTPGEFDGPPSVPILFLPGVTGIRPEHSIFALPYQRCNMVEYFTARGHRCYVLAPRWGSAKQVVTKCTVFDVRLDVAAALEHISAHESQKPYVIAHCQGSVALSMALLDGTVNQAQLIGIAANAVFMNQVFGYWNAVKAYSPILIRLYELLDGHYFPIAFNGARAAFHRALDSLLNFYPTPHRRDRCSSAACHRTSFAFGLLWNHENLNRPTHDNVDRFFNGTPTRLLEHVTHMGRHGGCLDNGLRPLMTRKNLERLRGLPVLFVSGADNEVFAPEATLRDYELVRRRFGERLYRRFLIEGYGHLDPVVGKTADEDVYWRVLDHVKWCSDYGKNDNGSVSKTRD